MESWLSKLKATGVDLGEVDEAKALQVIAQSYRDAQQARQLSPYVNSYLQHASEFNEYLQRKQQPQQATTEAKPFYADYWNPPQFDPNWYNLLAQDEQGNIVAKKGAPPDIVPKYLAYKQWRDDQTEKLVSNPHTFLEKTIRTLAAEEAQKIAQQQLGGYQEQISSHQFVEQNAPWLFEQNPTGGIKTAAVFDPRSGQYVQQRVLSPWGQRFQSYVTQEAQRQQYRGYQDLEEQKNNAMMRLTNEYMQSELAQKQVAPAPAASAAPAQKPAPTPREKWNEMFLGQQAGNGQAAQRGNSVPADTPVTDQNLYQTLLSAITSVGGA